MGHECCGGKSSAALHEKRESKEPSVTQYGLPSLPYDFGALEPVISGAIMELHYAKHHAAYVNNLNQALLQYAEAEAACNLSKMIQLEPTIRFNGGGHINHSIFWTNLLPPTLGGGNAPSGQLAEAIHSTFGSFDQFKATFQATAVAVQGSGWCWLGYDPTGRRLLIRTCANQDPLSTQQLVPLLGVDVWEHAYYLQYQNRRADYLKEIWGVVNWSNVSERYAACNP